MRISKIFFSSFVFLMFACRSTIEDRSNSIFMMQNSDGGGGAAAGDDSKEEENNIDAKMRVAYEKWKHACSQHNLLLTPAYDVVGLVAALKMHDLFSIEEKAFDLKKGAPLAKHFLLQKRSPDQLGEIFSEDNLAAKASEFPKNLLIITDHGEETDDEVTLLLAAKLQNYGVNVSAVFTSMHAEKEIRKHLSWAKEQDSHPIKNIYSLESFRKEAAKEIFFQEGKTVVLQIGPVHGLNPHTPNFLSHWSSLFKDVSYDYYLLGLYGSTLNSQRDAQEASALFQEMSANTFVIDTARGAGAFKFTVEGLSQVAPSVIDHAIKIAWRNTVGRASGAGGKFVAHLVAKTERGIGANYETINSMVSELESKDAPQKNALSLMLNKKVESVVDSYIEALKAAGPKFEVKEDGTTNSVAGVTLQEIKDGYAFILSNLYKYFGVPIEFFESGGPEAWKPEWLYPELKNREAAESVNALFRVTLTP